MARGGPPVLPTKTLTRTQHMAAKKKAKKAKTAKKAKKAKK
jgi:hypothetical protein